VPRHDRRTEELIDAAMATVQAAMGELGTGAEGLSTEQAEARLRRVGPNVLPRAKGPGLARRMASQLVHFFAIMLWAASVLAFVGGMPQLAAAIIAVVVVNGVFSLAQEERAVQATRALSRLLPEQAVVVRAGRKDRIPAEDLVPGDIVLLLEGDRISTDARVIRSDGLSVDNSTLTGESMPVGREEASIQERPADVTEAANLVFAGTYVASGSGRVVVLATSGNTRLGSISRLTGEVHRRPSPLRLDLDRAVRIIAAFAIAAGALFLVTSLAMRTDPRDGFLFSVGVIVALVPEGLLPTLTLSLAMSATRMAHRGALVRHLEAVETLGCTTVICSDKTGTMTTNQMTARAVIIAGERYRATGSGWDPEGALLVDDRPPSPRQLGLLGPLLRASALCGDARFEMRDGRRRCIGDPTEGALMMLAAKGGVERDAAERLTPRVHEYPFESARRRMSTAHALSSGEVEILVKGSPEAILERSALIRDGTGTRAMDADREASVLADVEALARDGLRVLAFARRFVPGAAVPRSADDAEQELEFLGLAGLEDPVRPEVLDAVADCRHAGIRVIMVTGDHPATARSVAAKVGLPNGRVVLGGELPEDDEALTGLLADTSVSVLARIAPEQKLRIAGALQAGGHVVAMTGDGVNDAPALRQADIGVAMGMAGTDVAREAADLVLLDDNFAHIVEAVEEGRAAFDNIKRFLTYHLTDNVAELMPFVVWALSGGRIPLVITVMQVLALDIGTDLLPALALGGERPQAGTMARPPRPRTAHLLDRGVLGRAFGFLGPIEAAISLALLPIGAALFFRWRPWDHLPHGGVPLETVSTMVFASIVLMQMANAFECRSTQSSLLHIGPFTNRLLDGAVAVEFVMLLAFVYVPPVADVLGQRSLAAMAWLPIAVAPWLLLGAEEARKARARRRDRARAA
jgi:magnesium-transporting ATPase (P-type)